MSFEYVECVVKKRKLAIAIKFLLLNLSVCLYVIWHIQGHPCECLKFLCTKTRNLGFCVRNLVTTRFCKCLCFSKSTNNFVWSCEQQWKNAPYQTCNVLLLFSFSLSCIYSKHYCVFSGFFLHKCTLHLLF